MGAGLPNKIHTKIKAKIGNIIKVALKPGSNYQILSSENADVKIKDSIAIITLKSKPAKIKIKFFPEITKNRMEGPLHTIHEIEIE
jgi:hypothetical protein